MDINNKLKDFAILFGKGTLYIILSLILAKIVLKVVYVAIPIVILVWFFIAYIKTYTRTPLSKWIRDKIRKLFDAALN